MLGFVGSEISCILVGSNSNTMRDAVFSWCEAEANSTEVQKFST
jgi:hypothetical protein